MEGINGCVVGRVGKVMGRGMGMRCGDGNGAKQRRKVKSRKCGGNSIEEKKKRGFWLHSAQSTIGGQGDPMLDCFPCI